MNKLIKKTKKNEIWLGYPGPEFSEGKFKGSVVIALKGSLLINVKDGSQYKVEIEDILQEIKKDAHPKS